MKHKILFTLLLLCSMCAFFGLSGCAPTIPPGRRDIEYTKEDFTFKFKNESTKPCYVEISGSSLISSIDYNRDYKSFESKIDIPKVLKTAIPIGGSEKTITVKDVVVSGKDNVETVSYDPNFKIEVIPQGSSVNGTWKDISPESKSQYSEGCFHITYTESGYYKYFSIDFFN